MNTNIGTKDAVTIVLSNVNKGTEEKIEYNGGSVTITQGKIQEKKAGGK